MGAPDESELRSRLESLFCGDDEQATIGTVVRAAMPDDGQWHTGYLSPPTRPKTRYSRFNSVAQTTDCQTWSTGSASRTTRSAVGPPSRS